MVSNKICLHWESYNISACKHWPVSFDYVCLTTGQVTTATAIQAHAWGAHAWGLMHGGSCMGASIGNVNVAWNE